MKNYSQSKLAAIPPNKKWAHILANLWWIDMKLAVSAYGYVLDEMTCSFHGDSGLLGPLIAASSYIW